MDAEGVGQERFAQVRDEIGGHGVHADDNQRERPCFMTANVHDPAKCGEKQEAEASAE